MRNPRFTKPGAIKNLILSIAVTFLATLQIGSAQTLLLRYNFDEADNGTTDALDLGADPLANGTFQGFATRTMNTPGGTSLGALDLSLTPTNELGWVSAGPTEKFDGVAQMTFTFWMHMHDVVGTADRIFGRLSGAAISGFDISISRTNQTVNPDPFRINVVVANLSGATVAASTATVNARGRWVFASASYDGTLTANNVKFHVGDETNAVAQLGNTISLNKGIPPANSFDDFMIGRTPATSGDRTPPAWLDDVRVYSGILTPAQLEVIRLESAPPPPPVIQISTPVLNGNMIEFSINTQSGYTYYFEYKDTFDAPSWQILSSVGGAPGTSDFSATATNTATRFYRIRAEAD